MLLVSVGDAAGGVGVAAVDNIYIGNVGGVAVHVAVGVDAGVGVGYNGAVVTVDVVTWL